MIKKLTRRSTLTGLVAAGMLATSSPPSLAADMTFTLATSGTERHAFCGNGECFCSNGGEFREA